MPSLADVQGNFIATIDEGPGRLDPALFAGSHDRILLGLKAHANTVSHARLISLEETFALTRQEIGEAAFNDLSRLFVDTAEGRATASNLLGKTFAAFLRRQRIDVRVAELAAIEWAWLESYHAADAIALDMADLARAGETGLAGICVALHPSVRTVRITAPLANALCELPVRQPHMVLAVRPAAEVRLTPIDRHQAVLLSAIAQKNGTIGNFMSMAAEQMDEQLSLDAFLHLVGAGALINTG